MSANTLTVVSTVAGIVVGFMTSWWFTRSSKLQADADRVVLLKEISTLRSLLNGVAESVIKPISTSVGVDQALRSAQLPDKVADTVARSIRSAASVSGTDVFVRATLGSLLDEHGEVSVSRLLRNVTHALPDAGLPSILSSLEELRKAGRVSWSGDDVRKAGVIKVHP